MWKNWQPEFEVTNYFSRSYQLDVLTGQFKLITSFLKTKLKELFQCDNCDYYLYAGDLVGYGSGIYWSYENNQLKYQSDSSSSTFNLYLFYKYSDVKTLKFKNQQDKSIIFTVFNDWHNVTDNLQNSILINGTSVKVFSIYTDISTITELTSLPYDEADYEKYFALRLNVSLLGNADLSFDYLTDFGIEDYYEPYYWDNMSWTPKDLEFQSVVGYNNTDLQSNGNAILLDATNDAFVLDNEGNQVSNNFLNKLARKIQVSNGFQYNNKTLEMIAFQNSVKSLNKNYAGQYIFSNNKTQTYWNNNEEGKIYQMQDVAYFGGQPAIYPVVIYNNMLSLNYNSSYPEIIKNNTSVIINNQNFPITEQDLVICYVRNAISPDKITYKTKPGRDDFLPSFTWDKYGNVTNVSFAIGSKTTQVDLDFKETNIWYDELPEKIDWTHSLTPPSSKPFGTIAQSVFESIIERDNLTFSMRGYMKHFPESWQFTANNSNWIYLGVGTFSGGGLSDAYFSIYASALQFPYIGNLSMNSSFMSELVKYNFEPDKWVNNDTLNFPLTFQVNTTPGVWPNLVGFFAEEYDKQSWTDSNGHQWTYFGRSYFDRKQYTSETGNNWVKYKDVQFAFEYRATGGTNKDICGYIEFENLSNPQAIAVVIWKNGKTLLN